MSFQHWTPEQWSVFTVTVAAGLIAVAVLRRARWTAPAPTRARGPAPRPSIVMTERRAIAAQHAPAWAIEAGYIEAERRPAPRVIVPWVDPMRADFTDPGIGALSSIQAVTVDPTLRTVAEVRAEEDMWINAYSDLTYFMPETDAAREQMRINTEPAMRTARLWLMRAGEVGARAALTDWRIDTPTGEYPMLTTADLHPYVAALLVP